MSWSRRSWDPSAVGKRVWTLPAPWGTPALGMLRKQPRRPPPRTADSSHFAVTVMSQLRGGPPAAKAAHQPGSRGFSERGGCRPPTAGAFWKRELAAEDKGREALGGCGQGLGQKPRESRKICLPSLPSHSLKLPMVL